MALDLLGVGISSLEEVEEGPPPRRLNLHMNRISDLAGLGRFARLEELILSANCITSLRCEHFQEQGQLKLLDLSCNQLQGLSGLQPLRALRELRVAYNQVQSLEGLQSFWGRQYELKVLDLRCNRIAGLPQLLFLGGCCKLEALRFKEGGGKENPICAETMYSSSVLMAAPWLQTLDGAPAQEAAEPKPAPAPAPEQSAKEELRRRELEQAGAELRAAQREAQLAEEQAMAAQNAAEEAAHRRAMQGAAREARLKADLEEIVQAVQKHEAHFAQELSKLEAADAELPAAQAAASAQEAQLRLEEQRCRELSSSEAREISLAASWKSERDAAEQMLTLWRQKSSTLPTYDVSALQRELLLTSEQLQETRRHLGDLPSLAEELREQEQRVLDARRDAREQECVARSWNLEAAAVAGRLASIRGAAAQSARAGAEMLDAAELQCKNYQESLAESLAEESMLRKEVDLQSRPETVQEGSLHWLLAERERLQAEVQEAEQAPDPGAAAVGALKGKLASVLEEAWQGLQETERRRRAVQEELEQKERALELARNQEQLDEVVLGEMQLQLARCREEEAAAVLQVQQKASEASYERLEAERVQQRSEEVEAQSEELQHLRSTEYARRSEYQDCVQAVKELKDEMQRQGEEQSHAAQRLESLRLALETRREELRLLLERLQQLQRAGDADLQRQKIKEQMIADAEQQVADLQQALAEAEKAKQENDLAWRDRLTEATTSAEEHAQRAEALRQSSLEHEEEIAKLRRQARAKGERNDYVEMQLEQVNRMTEERSSSLEAKVQAMRAEGGEVLDEARWAQSEMEQRFRSERAEQLQQEKDGRSRLAQLRPRLQRAPAQRLALERRIAEEKKASKERVARLLATFGAAPSWR